MIKKFEILGWLGLPNRKGAITGWVGHMPMPWPEFNRRCWELYGTGRTEPDE